MKLGNEKACWIDERIAKYLINKQMKKFCTTKQILGQIKLITVGCASFHSFFVQKFQSFSRLRESNDVPSYASYLSSLSYLRFQCAISIALITYHWKATTHETKPWFNE